jgi:hypothetical protein
MENDRLQSTTYGQNIDRKGLSYRLPNRLSSRRLCGMIYYRTLRKAKASPQCVDFNGQRPITTKDTKVHQVKPTRVREPGLAVSKTVLGNIDGF